MLSDASAVADLGARIASLPVFGLDTEFLRERTYYAQLCLLQFGLPDQALCVDTLAAGPLQALAPAFAARASCKVLHAARQDLEVLWPATGPIRNVYDTQVAAALIGFPAQVGYAELVNQMLGVKLAKSATRTDWSRRPLSAEQLDYALDDVRYLLPLREKLDERLAALGRSEWLREESAELDAVDNFETAPEEAWKRLKGLVGLDEWRLGLARALGAWRETRAQRANVPRSWVLPDLPLREMVLRVPRSAGQLAALPEMPEGVARNSGAELLQLIEAQSPPAILPQLPPRERPDETRQALVRKLTGVARRCAEQLGIAPEILATRRELERIAGGSREALPLRGWRAQQVGGQLLAAL
ncbi:MAG: HRDC domain-containing protein [Steroidobacteraceae bacterium]